jgi:hypothetical protein
VIESDLVVSPVYPLMLTPVPSSELILVIHGQRALGHDEDIYATSVAVCGRRIQGLFR